MTDEQTVEGEVKDLVITGEKVTRTLSLPEIKEIAQVFIQSGLFRDTADQAKAIVKIMAGNELGIGPFAAMRGFNIIQGQLAPAANFLGALIKASGKYDYRVTESNALKCHIEFFTNGAKIGDSEYTIEDAQIAGLANKDNWRKYPRQMLFARTLSEGGRMHCPDVFMWSVYVPEELGVDVVEGEFSTDLTIAPDATQKPQAAKIEPKPVGILATRPLPPETLKSFIERKATGYRETRKRSANDNQRSLLAGQLSTLFDGDVVARHQFTKWLAGNESTKEIDGAFVNALLDWLELAETDTGLVPSTFAIQEAKAAQTLLLLQEGQAELPTELKAA